MVAAFRAQRLGNPLVLKTEDGDLISPTWIRKQERDGLDVRDSPDRKGT